VYLSDFRRLSLSENLADIQKFECCVYWPEPDIDNVQLLMAHKAARAIAAATELHAHLGFHVDDDPVVQVVNSHPEYVHKIQSGILESSSPLLNSTHGTDLVKILSNNRIILLDPAQLDSYTDSNICQAPGIIPALLRRAWFDTYSFVTSNASLPDYSDWEM
jgi:hypothetical protein